VPGRLRPRVHLLCAVDDSRNGAGPLTRPRCATLNDGGSLHIVDFGRQERLPSFFRSGLRAWLAKFHVAPRDDLREVLESECRPIGASLRFDSLYRGYAVHAVVTRR
jgi:S-adenosylmethionine-diacylgycerolhomoserine-N-methlytransferase